MRSLTDRKTAPPRVQPVAASILLDRTLMGSSGRAKLRRVFGKEHETFEGSIPGMRFMPMWLFVLDENGPRLAQKFSEQERLPSVLLMGPYNKSFYTTLSAPDSTSEEDALKIVQFISEKVREPRSAQGSGS